MATVGLSKPYYAVYSASGTYTGGALLGKATELSISVETNNNILYADNAAAETDRTFSSGTLSITTDALSPSVAKAILGVEEESGGDWILYNDNQSIPYVGFGGIIKTMTAGTPTYIAVVLPKVQFSTPAIEATTQGESIEWKTQTLEATILRDTGASGEWMRLSKTGYSTESAAESAIKEFLDIT